MAELPRNWLMMSLNDRTRTADLERCIGQARQWGHVPPSDMNTNAKRLAWLRAKRGEQREQIHQDANRKKPARPGRRKGKATTDHPVRAFQQPRPTGNPCRSVRVTCTIPASDVNAWLAELPPHEQEGDGHA